MSEDTPSTIRIQIDGEPTDPIPPAGATLEEQREHYREIADGLEDVLEDLRTDQTLNHPALQTYQQCLMMDRLITALLEWWCR